MRASVEIVTGKKDLLALPEILTSNTIPIGILFLISSLQLCDIWIFRDDRYDDDTWFNSFGRVITVLKEYPQWHPFIAVVHYLINSSLFQYSFPFIPRYTPFSFCCLYTTQNFAMWLPPPQEISPHGTTYIPSDVDATGPSFFFYYPKEESKSVYIWDTWIYWYRSQKCGEV